MSLWAWAGLAVLIAGLVGAVIWLAQRLGAAKAETVMQEHVNEAFANAAKARRTAEDVVRAGGDGTVSDSLQPWFRD